MLALRSQATACYYDVLKVHRISNPRSMFRANFHRCLHVSLAPRGALTSRTSAFVARPWEVDSTESIDNLNGLGSAIKIQTRGIDLMRVLPRVNDDINDEWIDDKTRFSFDGNKLQRIIKPMVPSSQSPTPNWREALTKLGGVVNAKKNRSFRAITKSSTDLGSILALTDLAQLQPQSRPVEVIGSGSSSSFGNDLPSKMRFNTSIGGLNNCDVALTIGTNLFQDCPQLISRFRQLFLKGKTEVAHIGYMNYMDFPTNHLGLTPTILIDILKGQHPFAATLAEAQNPVLVVDASIYDRKDKDMIAATLQAFIESPDFPTLTAKNVSMLHSNANDVGVSELGRTVQLQPNSFSKDDVVDVLYLMQVGAADLPNGVDDVEALRASCKTLIFQGSHGDELAGVADFILPSCTFVEKKGWYGNTEGRFQESLAAMPPPGIGRQDWEVVRAVSEHLDTQTLPYDTYQELTERLKLLVPGIDNRDEFLSWDEEGDIKGLMQVLSETVKKQGTTELKPVPFKPKITDFYLEGHPLARTSPTMARLSKDHNPRESRNFF